MQLLHLSPSSMKDWRRCPHRFKLMRLDGIKVPYVTTINMDVGTVFDAHVKVRLNRRLVLSQLLKEVKNDEAIKIGSMLAEIYDRSGALKSLTDEGVGQVEIDKETIINGAVVYGKPDYTMFDGSIGDWKTSLSGSPKQGYVKRIEWLTQLNAVAQSPPHEKADFNLENIDEDWAFQTTVYAFLLGRRPMQGLKCRIEHVVCQANKVVIASYNNLIGLEFQNYVWDLIPEIWNKIKRMEIPGPVYSEYRCWAYGKKCEVAEKCEAFKAMADKDPNDPTSYLGAMG